MQLSIFVKYAKINWCVFAGAVRINYRFVEYTKQYRVYLSNKEMDINILIFEH